MSEGALAVTVLGADGSYPAPGGACSGYLVTCAGTRVWLDAGSGTMANLQRHVALTDVDAVVLSHGHPDHWSDLEGFYVACRWFLGRQGVPVYAPAGLRALTVGVADDGTFDWHEVDEGDQPAVGSLHLSLSRTDHPVRTLAVRLDGAGRSLVYSADTGPAWSLAALGQADLALVEATFLADREGTMQHLSARQAGAMAASAGAGRLVVTHIAPGVDRAAAEDEAAAAFGAPVSAAAPGAKYQA
ncbi:MAG: MBL fold metallo-hydrolase [Acidimicrobiales bacterium]